MVGGWLIGGFKKTLFRDISYNFLKVVLMPIVSLSLSLNELGNSFNCDTNLLMPKSLLLIQIKKHDLALRWLLIITFDVVRS